MSSLDENREPRFLILERNKFVREREKMEAGWKKEEETSVDYRLSD